MLDAPIASGSSVRAFNHLLGECELLICATVEQADRYRTNYPQSLDQAPFLMPLHSSSARRGLEAFFDRAHVRPRIVGEFEDSALMKVFGQLGTGLFPVPAVIQAEVERQHDVRVVGRVDGFVERFYAITAERRLKHPASSRSPRRRAASSLGARPRPRSPRDEPLGGCALRGRR